MNFIQQHSIIKRNGL